MSSEGERVSVQTYVSADQRERWREEADDLDMSQAEYVRSMVQAGRRSFDLRTGGDSLRTDSDSAADAPSQDATPGVEGLEDRILEILRTEEFADWDDLVDGVTHGIEERIEKSLQDMVAEGRVEHSPRRGGYTVVDDGR